MNDDTAERSPERAGDVQTAAEAQRRPASEILTRFVRQRDETVKVLDLSGLPLDYEFACLFSLAKLPPFLRAVVLENCTIHERCVPNVAQGFNRNPHVPSCVARSMTLINLTGNQSAKRDVGGYFERLVDSNFAKWVRQRDRSNESRSATHTRDSHSFLAEASSQLFRGHQNYAMQVAFEEDGERSMILAALAYLWRVDKQREFRERSERRLLERFAELVALQRAERYRVFDEWRGGMLGFTARHEALRRESIQGDLAAAMRLIYSVRSASYDTHTNLYQLRIRRYITKRCVLNRQMMQSRVKMLEEECDAFANLRGEHFKTMTAMLKSVEHEERTLKDEQRLEQTVRYEQFRKRILRLEMERLDRAATRQQASMLRLGVFEDEMKERGEIVDAETKLYDCLKEVHVLVRDAWADKTRIDAMIRAACVTHCFLPRVAFTTKRSVLNPVVTYRDTGRWVALDPTCQIGLEPTPQFYGEAETARDQLRYHTTNSRKARYARLRQLKVTWATVIALYNSVKMSDMSFLPVPEDKEKSAASGGKGRGGGGGGGGRSSHHAAGSGARAAASTRAGGGDLGRSPALMSQLPQGLDLPPELRSVAPPMTLDDCPDEQDRMPPILTRSIEQVVSDRCVSTHYDICADITLRPYLGVLEPTPMQLRDIQESCSLCFDVGEDHGQDLFREFSDADPTLRPLTLRKVFRAPAQLSDANEELRKTHLMAVYRHDITRLTPVHFDPETCTAEQMLGEICPDEPPEPRMGALPPEPEPSLALTDRDALERATVAYEAEVTRLEAEHQAALRAHKLVLRELRRVADERCLDIVHAELPVIYFNLEWVFTVSYAEGCSDQEIIARKKLQQSNKNDDAHDNNDGQENNNADNANSEQQQGDGSKSPTSAAHSPPSTSLVSPLVHGTRAGGGAASSSSAALSSPPALELPAAGPSSPSPSSSAIAARKQAEAAAAAKFHLAYDVENQAETRAAKFGMPVVLLSPSWFPNAYFRCVRQIGEGNKVLKLAKLGWTVKAPWQVLAGEENAAHERRNAFLFGRSSTNREPPPPAPQVVRSLSDPVQGTFHDKAYRGFRGFRLDVTVENIEPGDRVFLEPGAHFWVSASGSLLKAGTTMANDALAEVDMGSFSALNERPYHSMVFASAGDVDETDVCAVLEMIRFKNIHKRPHESIRVILVRLTPPYLPIGPAYRFEIDLRAPDQPPTLICPTKVASCRVPQQPNFGNWFGKAMEFLDIDKVTNLLFGPATRRSRKIQANSPWFNHVALEDLIDMCQNVSSAPAAVLFPDATLTCPDTCTFNGGRITISLLTGRIADHLWLALPLKAVMEQPGHVFMRLQWKEDDAALLARARRGERVRFATAYTVNDKMQIIEVARIFCSFFTLAELGLSFNEQRSSSSDDGVVASGGDENAHEQQQKQQQQVGEETIAGGGAASSSSFAISTTAAQQEEMAARVKQEHEPEQDQNQQQLQDQDQDQDQQGDDNTLDRDKLGVREITMDIVNHVDVGVIERVIHSARYSSLVPFKSEFGGRDAQLLVSWLNSDLATPSQIANRKKRSNVLEATVRVNILHSLLRPPAPPAAPVGAGSSAAVARAQSVQIIRVPETLVEVAKGMALVTPIELPHQPEDDAIIETKTFPVGSFLRFDLTGNYEVGDELRIDRPVEPSDRERQHSSGSGVTMAVGGGSRAGGGAAAAAMAAASANMANAAAAPLPDLSRWNVEDLPHDAGLLHMWLNEIPRSTWEPQLVRRDLFARSGGLAQSALPFADRAPCDDPECINDYNRTRQLRINAEGYIELEPFWYSQWKKRCDHRHAPPTAMGEGEADWPWPPFAAFNELFLTEDADDLLGHGWASGIFNDDSFSVSPSMSPNAAALSSSMSMATSFRIRPALLQGPGAGGNKGGGGGPVMKLRGGLSAARANIPRAMITKPNVDFFHNAAFSRYFFETPDEVYVYGIKRGAHTIAKVYVCPRSVLFMTTSARIRKEDLFAMSLMVSVGCTRALPDHMRKMGCWTLFDGTSHSSYPVPIRVCPVARPIHLAGSNMPRSRLYRFASMPLDRAHDEMCKRTPGAAEALAALEQQEQRHQQAMLMSNQQSSFFDVLTPQQEPLLAGGRGGSAAGGGAASAAAPALDGTTRSNDQQQEQGGGQNNSNNNTTSNLPAADGAFAEAPRLERSVKAATKQVDTFIERMRAVGNAAAPLHRPIGERDAAMHDGPFRPFAIDELEIKVPDEYFTWANGCYLTYDATFPTTEDLFGLLNVQAQLEYFREFLRSRGYDDDEDLPVPMLAVVALSDADLPRLHTDIAQSNLFAKQLSGSTAETPNRTVFPIAEKCSLRILDVTAYKAECCEVITTMREKRVPVTPPLQYEESPLARAAGDAVSRANFSLDGGDGDDSSSYGSSDDVAELVGTLSDLVLKPSGSRTNNQNKRSGNNSKIGSGGVAGRNKKPTVGGGKHASGGADLRRQNTLSRDFSSVVDEKGKPKTKKKKKRPASNLDLLFTVSAEQRARRAASTSIYTGEFGSALSFMLATKREQQQQQEDQEEKEASGGGAAAPAGKGRAGSSTRRATSVPGGGARSSSPSTPSQSNSSKNQQSVSFLDFVAKIHDDNIARRQKVLEKAREREEAMEAQQRRDAASAVFALDLLDACTAEARERESFMPAALRLKLDGGGEEEEEDAGGAVREGSTSGGAGADEDDPVFLSDLEEVSSEDDDAFFDDLDDEGDDADQNLSAAAGRDAGSQVDFGRLRRQQEREKRQREREKRRAERQRRRELREQRREQQLERQQQQRRSPSSQLAEQQQFVQTPALDLLRQVAVAVCAAVPTLEFVVAAAAPPPLEPTTPTAPRGRSPPNAAAAAGRPASKRSGGGALTSSPKVVSFSPIEDDLLSSTSTSLAGGGARSSAAAAAAFVHDFVESSSARFQKERTAIAAETAPLDSALGLFRFTRLTTRPPARSPLELLRHLQDEDKDDAAAALVRAESAAALLRHEESTPASGAFCNEASLGALASDGRSRTVSFAGDAAGDDDLRAGEQPPQFRTIMVPRTKMIPFVSAMDVLHTVAREEKEVQEERERAEQQQHGGASLGGGGNSGKPGAMAAGGGSTRAGGGAASTAGGPSSRRGGGLAAAAAAVVAANAAASALGSGAGGSSTMMSALDLMYAVKIRERVERHSVDLGHAQPSVARRKRIGFSFQLNLQEPETVRDRIGRDARPYVPVNACLLNLVASCFAWAPARESWIPSEAVIGPRAFKVQLYDRYVPGTSSTITKLRVASPALSLPSFDWTTSHGFLPEMTVPANTGVNAAKNLIALPPSVFGSADCIPVDSCSTFALFFTDESAALGMSLGVSPSLAAASMYSPWTMKKGPTGVVFSANVAGRANAARARIIHDSGQGVLVQVDGVLPTPQWLMEMSKILVLTPESAQGATGALPRGAVMPVSFWCVYSTGGVANACRLILNIKVEG